MREARLKLIIDIKLIIKGTVVDQENKWSVSVLSVVFSGEKKINYLTSTDVDLVCHCIKCTGLKYKSRHGALNSTPYIVSRE